MSLDICWDSYSKFLFMDEIGLKKLWNNPLKSTFKLCSIFDIQNILHLFIKYLNLFFFSMKPGVTYMSFILQTDVL